MDHLLLLCYTRVPDRVVKKKKSLYQLKVCTPYIEYIINTKTNWVRKKPKYNNFQKLIDKNIKCKHNTSLPNSNLSGLRSTPMIFAAPRSLAPSATASPTAPRPKTATVEPSSTLATFQAAPTPAPRDPQSADMQYLTYFYK